MARTNILTRLSVDFSLFSKEERAAQAKALAITTKAKTVINSPEALTIEGIFPEFAQAAPAVTAIVNKLCTLLANPVIGDDLDTASAILGRYGAKLTQALDNNPDKTFGDYIIIFESLFTE